MKWMKRVSSLFLLGYSALIFFSSLKLGMGDTKKPGPGFMPMLASLLVFCLSSFIFIKELKGSEPEEKKGALKGQKYFFKGAILIVAVLGYSVLLEWVGYLIAIFLLMFGLFSVSEPKKWHKNIAIAAVVAILSFVIFRRLLGVQLPTGMFKI